MAAAASPTNERKTINLFISSTRFSPPSSSSARSPPPSWSAASSSSSFDDGKSETAESSSIVSPRFTTIEATMNGDGERRRVCSKYKRRSFAETTNPIAFDHAAKISTSMRGARPLKLFVLFKSINTLFVRLGCLKIGPISSKRAHSVASTTSFGDTTQIEIAFWLEIFAHFLVIEIVARFVLDIARPTLCGRWSRAYGKNRALSPSARSDSWPLSRQQTSAGL